MESHVGVGITKVITEGSLDVPWGLNDGGTKVLVTLDNHQLVAVGRKGGQSTELVRQEVGLASAFREKQGKLLSKDVDPFMDGTGNLPLGWCPSGAEI